MYKPYLDPSDSKLTQCSQQFGCSVSMSWAFADNFSKKWVVMRRNHSTRKHGIPIQSNSHSFTCSENLRKKTTKYNDEDITVWSLQSGCKSSSEVSLRIVANIRQYSEIFANLRNQRSVILGNIRNRRQFPVSEVNVIQSSLSSVMQTSVISDNLRQIFITKEIRSSQNSENLRQSQ